MKSIKKKVILISLGLVFSSIGYRADALSLVFSDYNTSICLFVDTNSRFTLIGYGGSDNHSAGCIIKACGYKSQDSLIGFLKDVNSSIVSYKVNDSLQHSFTAILRNDLLTINRADVFDLCGVGANFTREYKPVINQTECRKKLSDIIDLFAGLNENTFVLNDLNQLLTQKTVEAIHSTALARFKSGDKTGAASIVKQFLKTTTVCAATITSDNIDKYNDLGFFLEQGKDCTDAIPVLEAVLKIQPTRIVAHINIGDAFFACGRIEDAKSAYLRYIDLMKKDGKEKKIPQRVIDRTK
jgi:hypothetical protein